MQDHSDSEEEEEKPRFPTMEEARYNLRQNKLEIERIRRQSERPEYFETEKDSGSENEESNEEEIQGYDPDSSNWIVRKLQKQIEKEFEIKHSRDLIKSDLIKIQLIDAINPFIKECRELIKMLPASVLKRDYPSWNHNQIINYWWSGDINEGLDDLGFSLADNPYLPPSVAFGGRFAHDYQDPVQFSVQAPAQIPNPFQGLVLAQVPVQIEINEDLFEDKDDFATLPASPQALAPASPGSSQAPTTDQGAQATTTSGAASTSRGPSDATLQKYGIKPYDLANVRPKLQRVPAFAEASKIPNLNSDEGENFKKAYYLHSKLRELQQEEGQTTRANKTGIRSFLTKKKT